jgi:phosphomannomutase
MSFEDWRLNVRKSNTEPLVRLNVEAHGGGVDLDAKIESVTDALLI